MWKVDSLEKTLMLGWIGGRRRRGWQKMRWLDGTTNLMEMSLGELWELVMDREAWLQFMGSQRVRHDWATELNWTDIRNWLTWLWRLRSPKDLYSEGLRPRRASAVSSSPSSSLRAKADWCPSSKTGRKRMNSSLLRFYPGFQWTEWGPPTFGVQSALLSLQIQKLISSRNTFTDTPRIMFNQVSGPHGTVKWTINKINHHNLPPEETKQNLSPLDSTSSPITLPFHSLLQWNFSEDLCLSTMLPPSEACPLNRPMKCQTLPQCPYST